VRRQRRTQLAERHRWIATSTFTAAKTEIAERHTTWTSLACGVVVYGPALRLDCRVLAGPAAVR
jgi:hypothetical protein